jgi:predicted enzyme related to lactoylglutathione lyase
MGRRDRYEPGVPCWADVSVDDLDGARAFYSALFGWEPDVSDVPDAGGYTNFRLDGLTVAGAGPKTGGDMPDAWSVFVATDDVARSLEVAAGVGGEVVAGPIEIPTRGTFGLVADPNGAFVGLWAASGHIGAQIVNDPNTFVWNELATPDLASSVDFYRTLFGWGWDEHGGGGIFTTDAGRALCGAHPVGDGEPPYWTVWFAVHDCDGAVATVVDLGGQVLMPPEDMSFGRGAVVAAPGGAAFGVAAMTEVDD